MYMKRLFFVLAFFGLNLVSMDDGSRSVTDNSKKLLDYHSDFLQRSRADLQEYNSRNSIGEIDIDSLAYKKRQKNLKEHREQFKLTEMGNRRRFFQDQSRIYGTTPKYQEDLLKTTIARKGFLESFPFSEPNLNPTYFFNSKGKCVGLTGCYNACGEREEPC